MELADLALFGDEAFSSRNFEETVSLLRRAEALRKIWFSLAKLKSVELLFWPVLKVEKLKLDLDLRVSRPLFVGGSNFALISLFVWM